MAVRNLQFQLKLKFSKRKSEADFPKFSSKKFDQFDFQYSFNELSDIPKGENVHEVYYN